MRPQDLASACVGICLECNDLVREGLLDQELCQQNASHVRFTAEAPLRNPLPAAISLRAGSLTAVLAGQDGKKFNSTPELRVEVPQATIAANSTSVVQVTLQIDVESLSRLDNAGSLLGMVGGFLQEGTHVFVTGDARVGLMGSRREIHFELPQIGFPVSAVSNLILGADSMELSREDLQLANKEEMAPTSSSSSPQLAAAAAPSQNGLRTDAVALAETIASALTSIDRCSCVFGTCDGLADLAPGSNRREREVALHLFQHCCLRWML